MIRLHFSEEQLAELAQLRRAPLKPSERDRVEMLLLHQQGWSAPRIARFLGYSDEWVRLVFKAFASHGTASIPLHRPGPAPDWARFRQVRQALRPLLQQPRSWSSPQLSNALKEHGLHLSARQVRRYLRRMNARYRRTRTSLRHRQDPRERQRARRQLGAYRSLALRRRLRLFFFDECGFSPSQPTGRSWFLPGQRRDIPYESPCGRRVTVLGTYAPYSRRRQLRGDIAGKRVTSERILKTIRRIPHSRRRKTVVVMDNAPIHRSRVSQAGFRALASKGLKVVFLPPYCPELNRIEEEFGVIKYHHLPERTYVTQHDLEQAVSFAFRVRAAKLAEQTPM